MEKMEYIHNNPVAEEIVAEPEHYLYSSAGDYYYGKKGFWILNMVNKLLS